MTSSTKRTTQLAIGYALISALLYAFYPPLAKLLIHSVPVAILSSLLYLGTGIGTALIYPLVHRGHHVANGLKRSDTTALIAVIGFNIVASILMNLALKLSDAGSVSLLGNFEIVATSVLAMLFFHEHISQQLGLGIVVITIASILLSSTGVLHFSFSLGAVLALIATACWGLENNLTRVLSDRDPLQVVIVKGLGVGIGSLIVSVALRESWPAIGTVIAALILGFFAYGISIVFYILAQRSIGAAKTSAYYAVAPFLAVVLSFFLLGERPTALFGIALVLMIIGTVFVTLDDMKN
ncbi:DMT family transporter [Secundilactobacillus paracollinoides]|uniref:DMT family transporter n=1 Tax=Secundilactobacillus paracollinoides TaxID=240427 RepID=UPI0006F12E04|nr:DMT family transporter [Secundilactobacillus paracollinoides]KRL76130.1 membrane protein [Secundilactobacillus paracollinoides DSM 15502 = JCM 11969]